MRVCIQRVSRAKVTLPISGEVSGAIGPGLLIFLGVGSNDTIEQVHLLSRKIAGLRIFDDDQGKMNLSLKETGGEILVVSQFTLFGNCRRGNRPSFTEAASPTKAVFLYEALVRELHEQYGYTVATGRFQTDMEVELVNDGPVTIWLDTADLNHR